MLWITPFCFVFNIYAEGKYIILYTNMFEQNILIQTYLNVPHKVTDIFCYDVVELASKHAQHLAWSYP